MRKAAHRTPEPSTSRERILARAIDLLAVHGFDAMTMRLLGAAVGLDNSSLYRHFPSKAALIDAVLDEVARDVAAAVVPSFDPAAPLTLRMLEDIGAAAGKHLFDRPANARLLIHWIMSTGEVAGPATDKARPMGKLLSPLLARLEEAARQGRIRKHKTVDALAILVGAIVVRPATHGHLFKSLETSRRSDAARDAFEKELRAVIRGAFAP